MPRITRTASRRGGAWTELFTAARGSLRLPAAEVPGGVATGSDLSEEQWRDLQQRSRYFVLQDTAIRMLGRRDHFEAELRRKLAQRERSGRIVDSVIDWCRERQYLDDGRALAQAVERLQSRGPLGEARVRAELYRLGCPAGLVAEGVARFREQADPEADLLLALDKKRRFFAGKLEGLHKRANRDGRPGAAALRNVRHKLQSAVYAYLAGRGFAPEQCARGAERLVAELAGED